MIKISINEKQRHILERHFMDNSFKDTMVEIFEKIYKKKEKALRSLNICESERGRSIGILETIDTYNDVSNIVSGKEQ